MDAGEQFLSDFREAITAASPHPKIQLDRIDLYLGANPLSDRPAIVAQIRTSAAASCTSKLYKQLEKAFDIKIETKRTARDALPIATIAPVVAAATAALLTRELRIETDCGARARRDGSAECWIELLRGGPAGFALKAVLAATAAALGDASPAEVSATHLKRLRELCLRSRPNRVSGFLIEAARAKDIPCAPLARSKAIWQFGWGSRGRAFLGAACNEDGYVAFNMARLKPTAKWLFHELGLPTPHWTEVGAGEDPAPALARIGFPCVVKPVDSSLGEGITANIRTAAEYRAAIALGRSKAERKLLVEAHVPGEDHRLLVVEGRLLAAVRRDPPTVTGDGVQSVRELIAGLNETRRRIVAEGGYLIPVDVDPALLLRLHGEGLGVDSVLTAGRTLALRTVANRSAGGSSADVTKRVHPQVRAWAEQLAITVGLRVTGIDYVTPDISADPRAVGGGFIEINATPGLHVIGAAGIDLIEIGAAILGTGPARIPVDLVLTDQEEEVAAKIPREMGHAIAWPSGMELNGSHIDARAMSPFDIVGAALRNRMVDRATVVWSCAQLARFGVPIDRIHRTTIVGSPPDHAWVSLLRRLSRGLVTVDALSARLVAAEPA